MINFILVVPGWPSSKNPGRMPFLRDFANAMARKTSTCVVVLDSLGGALRRGDLFTSFHAPDSQSYRILRVPILNLRIDALMRLQLRAWARIVAWRLGSSGAKQVNSHFNEVVPFGGPLAACLKAQHIVTEHASHFSCAVPRGGRGRTARIELLTAADALVAVGPKLADDITRDTGIARERIEVIGNGIDDIAAAVPDPEPNRDPATTRFVFVGHLIERKRVKQLVKTFKRLRVTRPIELEIIGDGPLRRDVLNLMEAGDASGRRLTYFGQLEKSEVMTRIGLADFLVLPSEYESFGIVAAEALAFGTACIVSRCGGPEYFVRDGIDGRHFEVDDLNALAWLMTAAAEGEITFDRALLRAQNAERFSWDTIAVHYLRLAGNDQ